MWVLLVGRVVGSFVLGWVVFLRRLLVWRFSVNDSSRPDSNIEKCRELAWALIVVHLPFSWIEKPNGKGLSEKAIRLRNAIAEELQRYFNAGEKEGKR